MDECVFCRIVRGELPSKKIFEDDEVLAFHDVRPVAPVHFMLVPKRHIASLAQVSEADSPLLGKMLTLVPRLASEQGSPDGFRTIINTGRVGRQEVYHLHIHVLGGPVQLPPMIAKS